MAYSLADAQSIPIERIFLDRENPRHKPYKNETEVIEYLCREEYLYELAKDIATNGLNPLELFALIPLSEKKNGAKASYMVVEGNRRICALKLLHDPDSAPAKQRKAFTELADTAKEVSKVLSVVFNNKDEVDVWLPRIHGGLQGGIGRKPWSAEQKTRYMGDKKNILAQKVLDYAEKKGFISPAQRKGKLTTIQRYLSNGFLREAIGIENSSNLDDISRTRPQQDIDLLVKQLIADLRSGVVNSRANSGNIKNYSRTLGAIKGLTGRRNEPESLSRDSRTGGKQRRQAPKRPETPTHIAYEKEISQKLKAIPSYKLERIYYSLCDISLEDHCPLLSVGAWSFFECLTANHGRLPSKPFCDYLNGDKLNKMGFSEKEDRKSFRQAIERISKYGNTTKHHNEAALFHGDQLANDMDILKEVICKLADEAKEKT